jgi:hypothetical protein
VPTVNRASSTTISAETVSATSGAAIDRGKMNMATPYANGNSWQLRPMYRGNYPLTRARNLQRQLNNDAPCAGKSAQGKSKENQSQTNALARSLLPAPLLQIGLSRTRRRNQGEQALCQSARVA